LAEWGVDLDLLGPLVGLDHHLLLHLGDVDWNPDSPDSEQLDIDANQDMDLESEGYQDPDLGEPAHWSYYVAPLTSVGVVSIVIIGLVWLYKKRLG
jgi:hypothetical protein